MARPGQNLTPAWVRVGQPYTGNAAGATGVSTRIRSSSNRSRDPLLPVEHQPELPSRCRALLHCAKSGSDYCKADIWLMATNSGSAPVIHGSQLLVRATRRWVIKSRAASRTPRMAIAGHGDYAGAREAVAHRHRQLVPPLPAMCDPVAPLAQRHSGFSGSLHGVDRARDGRRACRGEARAGAAARVGLGQHFGHTLGGGNDLRFDLRPLVWMLLPCLI
jgi:hypothetical protein